MPLIILGGAPGVGKSTVQNVALEQLQTIKPVKVATFGDYMFEIAVHDQLVKNRDEMRTKIPREKYKDLQAKAAEQISKDAKDRNIIVNTHLSMVTSFGLIPGLPLDILKMLAPKIIVVIEADPDEITLRQKEDKDRERSDFGDADKLRDFQNYSRSCAAVYSVIQNVPVKIILNRQGKIRDAANELTEVLKNVF
ncbi:MAG: adenylate kinase [Candidatus Aenigmarchaeota archaeon]|nr:adenylate kinase [Candidatus Aenigmarchaeota archaeon]